MASAGDLVINWIGNSSSAVKSANTVRSSISSVVKYAAGAAAIIGATFSVQQAVQAAEVQLQAEKKLEAVLKATGFAAGFSADEIKRLASERQAVTNFGDEATIAASGVLATFKEIKGDVFSGAIVAAQDLSSVMGQDLNSSIVQIGKALNDPIRGVTALSRVGVSFTDDQRKQIKTLQESGDMLGAQGIILDELKGEFGGAAEAMASPFTQMNNAVGDVIEQVGFALRPAFASVAEFVTAQTPVMIDAFASITPVVTQFFDTVVSMGGFLLDYWGFLWDTASNIASPVFELLGLTGATTFNDLIEYGVGFLAAVEFIYSDFQRNFELAFAVVSYAGVKTFNELTHWLGVTLPEIMSWFADNWQDIFFTIGDFTLTVFANLGENIRSIMGEVWDFIASGGTDAIEFAWTPLAEGFVNTIRDLPELTAREIGPLEKQLKDEAAALGNQFSTGLTAHIQSKLEEYIPAFGTQETDQAGAELREQITEAANRDTPGATQKQSAAEKDTGSRGALTAISGAEAIATVFRFQREQEQRQREQDAKARDEKNFALQQKMLEEQQRQTRILESETVLEAV